MTAFRHGIASADPRPEGVLLWTRLTAPGAGEVGVDWWVSSDPAGDRVVARGTAEAAAEGDHTVHVEAGGLEPATAYWYGFRAGDDRSPVGRTRTAPAPGRGDAQVRVGLVSCSSWPCGYFNAYANLAARDVDLVVHAGDYLYENDRASLRPDSVRAHRPRGVLLTLDDYRRRHAQHRTDPDLQSMLARHPLVAAWDDHEIAGGAWRDGASDHGPGAGSWPQRRAAAMQAYLEWIPVRAEAPATVYRSLELGSLGDLVMLDTRHAGRERPAALGRPVVRLRRGDRGLLGEDQWRWLEGRVASARGRWLLLGNQVMLAPARVLSVAGGLGINPSQWDGYPAERDRLFAMLAANGWGTDVAVLSGDFHSSWAADLPVGAEFVSPSVTTDSFARAVLPAEWTAAAAAVWFRTQNRHLRMVELRRHGYVVVDITADRIQADWWHLATVARRDRRERWAGGWLLRHGKTGLERAPAPAPVLRRAPAGAP